MVSCSFVQLCCVMTPCFFLFGASSHPYIPLHFEEMIFPLVCEMLNSQQGEMALTDADLLLLDDSDRSGVQRCCFYDQPVARFEFIACLIFLA